jgi:hypothetical protein
VKKLAITLTLLAIPAMGLADPYLISESVDLGDGWTGYTVSLTGGGYDHASWEVDLYFYGYWGDMVHQQQAFGSLDVDREMFAETFDPIDPNYDKDFDSWVFDEWGALATGISGLPDEPFHIHAGTPGGMAYETLPLAYVVCDGQLHWHGTITRDGVAYSGASTTIACFCLDHDGPYEIAVGESLALNAHSSFAYGNYLDLFEWDLDGDGVYETVSGNEPTLTVGYDYLESLGLGVGGPYPIGLRGTSDMWGESRSDTTWLTIVPEPTTGLLTMLGLLLVRRRRN